MDIVEFVKSFPVQTFQKDELLATAGQPNNHFYAIREGFIRVSSIDDTGRHKLLWIAGRYDLVPLEQFFSQKNLRYYYSGYGDGSVYVLDKIQMLEAFKRHPEVLGEVARGLSEHYDDLLERMNAVEQSDVRSKLLHILHNLCLKFSPLEQVSLHEIGLNLTHQDLADMIGSTREATSLELSKLRKQGYLDYSRSEFSVDLAKIKSEINLYES